MVGFFEIKFIKDYFFSGLIPELVVERKKKSRQVPAILIAVGFIKGSTKVFLHMLWKLPVINTAGYWAIQFI